MVTCQLQVPLECVTHVGPAEEPSQHCMVGAAGLGPVHWQLTPVEPPSPTEPFPPVPGLAQALIVQATSPPGLQLQLLQPSDEGKLLPTKYLTLL